jgi:hypothetical protein
MISSFCWVLQQQVSVCFIGRRAVGLSRCWLVGCMSHSCQAASVVTVSDTWAGPMHCKATAQVKRCVTTNLMDTCDMTCDMSCVYMCVCR